MERDNVWESKGVRHTQMGLPEGVGVAARANILIYGKIGWWEKEP